MTRESKDGRPQLALVPIAVRALLGLTAVGLIEWAVLTFSFSQHLASEWPEAALRLDPANTAAFGTIATRLINPSDRERLLASGPAPASIAAVRGAALREALKKDALNSSAWSALAIFDMILGKDGDAAKEFAHASRLDLHNSQAQMMSLKQFLDAGDLDRAIETADVLLRTSITGADTVIKVLARLSETPAGMQRIVARLAANPPWRRIFLDAFSLSVTETGSPLRLLLALRATSSPPSLDEVAPYVRFLARQGDFGLAYYAWLQFLPPEQLSSARLLFNGDFSRPLTNVPFDWRIQMNSGSVVETAPHPGGGAKRGLRVVMSGARVDFEVSTVSVLAPGRYKFSGTYRTDISAERGLRWRIRCIGGKQVGDSEQLPNKASDDTAFSIAFAVPEQGCDAISTSLTFDSRMSSEQLAAGVAWFADLAITALFDDACRGSSGGATCN